MFKEGQSFRKGETIINIDADEYAASVQSAKSNLFNQLTAVMPDLRLDYPDIYSKWQDYLTNFDMSKSTPALPELATEKEKFFISAGQTGFRWVTAKKNQTAKGDVPCSLHV